MKEYRKNRLGGFKVYVSECALSFELIHFDQFIGFKTFKEGTIKVVLAVNKQFIKSVGKKRANEYILEAFNRQAESYLNEKER